MHDDSSEKVSRHRLNQVLRLQDCISRKARKAHTKNFMVKRSCLQHQNWATSRILLQLTAWTCNTITLNSQTCMHAAA